MKGAIMVVIILLLGVMVVIWYRGHVETMEWYERIAGWNRLNAIESTPQRPQPPDPAGMISVSAPEGDARVGHSFTVEGRARGTWYADGAFPVEIQNESGVVLVRASAKAAGDWMSPDFVPFSLEVATPYYSGPARIVLKMANPSDRPERDTSISIPVMIQ